MDIIKIIENHGLKAASQRNQPMLVLSVVGEAYTQGMKKEYNISWGAVGAIGSNGWFYTLLNEKRIAKDLGKIIQKKLKTLAKDFLIPSMEKFEKIKSKIDKIEDLIEKNPLQCMKVVTANYSQYVTILGLYNCFLRYFNHTKESLVDKRMMKRIGNERNTIALLYSRTEAILDKCSILIGKQKHFEGFLLRYCTLDEIKAFLKTQKISKNQLETLKKRKEEYLYLCTWEKKKDENVFTDKKIIKDIKQKCFDIENKETSILKGKIAYPGIVKGRVYNLVSGNKPKTRGFILVAPMTVAKNVPLMKQSKGIVTDEGGILSHAAIMAREFEKPCIIGTKFATKVLKDGDLVEVDANKGIVRKLE